MTTIVLVRSPGFPSGRVPMTPQRIIKYVHSKDPDYWRKTCSLTCRGFGELLPRGEGSFMLSDTDYSRLTNPDPRREASTELCEILARPDVQQRIAKSVNCPGLFDCHSENEIDAVYDAANPYVPIEPVEGAELVLVPESLDESAIRLHACERQAIQNLHNLVVDSGRRIVCWADAPAIGPAFIAYVLAATFLQTHGVAKPLLLRPFGDGHDRPVERGPDEDKEEPERPFDSAIDELARHLEIQGRPSAGRLLEALDRLGVVLFVLHASLIRDARKGPNTLRELLGAVAASGPPRSTPASVVLIGKPPNDVPANMAIGGQISETLRFKTGDEQERNHFFEVQWKRFCSLRGHVVPDDDGTRTKRARDYHGGDPDGAPWPSTIRMLAFLASNYRTFGYFDPTAGWRRLAAMSRERLPIDIRLGLDEAAILLRGATDRKPSVRRAVRWCSTALYWLTEEAVVDLGQLSPRLPLEGFRDAVGKSAGIVKASEVEGQQVYKVDLALRALIQDGWIDGDPFGRACAHYSVAQRLYNSRNDKKKLNHEFPFEPHWGRSRMHFLVESLRHFMRSCEGVALSPGRASLVKMFGGEVPRPPLEVLGGADPHQVVNFCFADIYWQQLNDNSRTGTTHNRKLSRQHGAYQLTGELLQLMSEGGVLGKPHPAMDSRYKGRYLREVAYAQIDLGDLLGAEASFRDLIAWDASNNTELLDSLDYRLDRVVALTAMDDVEAAQQALDEIADHFRAHPSEGTARSKKINTRIDARQAQLHYLHGDFDEAYRLYARMEETEKTSSKVIVRDVAHAYIATLASLGGSAHLTKAMTLCVKNLFASTSAGLHHQALGFRVAQAHLFRKLEMVEVAEAMLDPVYRDIQLYGCSERAYLAFLLEAGRVVATLPQPRFARAYAAFLRPCFDRATSRGYVRTAEAARREADACLQRLQAEYSERGDPSPAEVRAKLKGRGDYRVKPDRRGDYEELTGRSVATDPLYAFDTDQIDRWVDRLGTRESIERERALLAEACDAPPFAGTGEQSN